MFIEITRKFIFIAFEVYMTIDISVDYLFKLFLLNRYLKNCHTKVTFF